MFKRLLMVHLLTIFLAVWSGASIAADITVYKDPNCGCCSKWATHLRDHSFSVTEVAVDDINMYKSKYNVPANMASCHTAIVEDYVIEGHVPAADILRLLKDRPDILGLTVPGMTLGSPGMEVGDQVQAFDVIAINKDGTTTVFSSYPEK